MPVPRATPVSLTPQQRQDLLRLARATSTPQALARRANIVLRAADDDRPTNQQIAAELGCDHDTVACWRRRFTQHGLDGLLDRPRCGRPPVFSPPAEAPCP
jgi:hypothetical protein